MSPVGIGTYQIQRDAEGHFIVTEMIGGERSRPMEDLSDVASYIQSDAEYVADSIPDEGVEL